MALEKLVNIPREVFKTSKEFVSTTREFVKEHQKAMVFLGVGTAMDAMITYLFIKKFDTPFIHYEYYAPLAAFQGAEPEVGILGAHVLYVGVVAMLGANLERMRIVGGEAVVVGLAAPKYIGGILNLAFVLNYMATNF